MPRFAGLKSWLDSPYRFPWLLWGLLFILIPLAYNPYSRWQYEPDKAALLVLMSGLLWGWSLARTSIQQQPPDRIEQCMAILMVVMLASTAASVLPHWSLWGDPAWRNGLLITGIGFGLFWLARRQIMTLHRQLFTLDAIILGSVPVVVCAICEWAGIEVLVPDEDPARLAGTLAHPNLLAAYLAMVLPLGLARSWMLRRHWWTSCVILLITLQMLSLVLTYSRAGWLAALTGLAVTLVGFLWVYQQKALARLLLVAVCAGLLMLVMLSVVIPPLPNDAPHPLQTATSLFRWSGATAQIRISAWVATLDAIGDRPWLGYGPGTYRIVLQQYTPPELARFGGPEAMGGRPHNLILRVAVESGVVALGIYLAFLALVLQALVRTIRAPGKSQQEQLIIAAVGGSLAANLVANTFSFESVTSGLLFWVLLGMALSKPGPRPVVPHRTRPIAGKIVALAGLGLALWMLVPDVLGYYGETRCQEEQCDQVALRGIETAGRVAPTPEIYHQIEARLHAQIATQTGAEDHWASGGVILASLTGEQPQIVAYWRERGMYLRRWFRATDRQELADESIIAYSHAVALSPRDPDLRIDRALTYLDGGDIDAALADLAVAEALLADYPRYYGAMSIVAAHQGDITATNAWQARAREAQQAWDDYKWRR
ncbi:MAG: hypothetical protein GYB66_00235 [Chloroflexi bacterium]|nr:hypothetical protein [Chloroflexota bacterium]